MDLKEARARLIEIRMIAYEALPKSEGDVQKALQLIVDLTKEHEKDFIQLIE